MGEELGIEGVRRHETMSCLHFLMAVYSESGANLVKGSACLLIRVERRIHKAPGWN